MKENVNNNQCLNAIMEAWKNNKNTWKDKEVEHNNKDQKRWATSTYVGKEVRSVSKLFTHANTKISFKTSSTIKHHLCSKTEIKTNTYEKSGVCHLNCSSCLLKYVCQTGRSFEVRCREHFHAIRSNQGMFAQHILETTHIRGPLKDKMDVLYIVKKGNVKYFWKI